MGVKLRKLHLVTAAQPSMVTSEPDRGLTYRFCSDRMLNYPPNAVPFFSRSQDGALSDVKIRAFLANASAWIPPSRDEYSPLAVCTCGSASA
ncbi:hypothetical protein D9615_006064 [Tricholomella constricta]|uniref:Uncharacterized protein n=1 Tax=Tricholomella constricta TaxID=117010 RepID=A0A8H5H9C4_9AGAR|nr:hypothetical protein D9615_006064 [Tricholomella constricta]